MPVWCMRRMKWKVTSSNRIWEVGSVINLEILIHFVIYFSFTCTWFEKLMRAILVPMVHLIFGILLDFFSWFFSLLSHVLSFFFSTCCLGKISRELKLSYATEKTRLRHLTFSVNRWWQTNPYFFFWQFLLFIAGISISPDYHVLFHPASWSKLPLSWGRLIV